MALPNTLSATRNASHMDRNGAQAADYERLERRFDQGVRRLFNDPFTFDGVTADPMPNCSGRRALKVAYANILNEANRVRYLVHSWNCQHSTNPEHGWADLENIPDGTISQMDKEVFGGDVEQAEIAAEDEHREHLERLYDEGWTQLYEQDFEYDDEIADSIPDGRSAYDVVQSNILNTANRLRYCVEEHNLHATGDPESFWCDMGDIPLEVLLDRDEFLFGDAVEAEKERQAKEMEGEGVEDENVETIATELFDAGNGSKWIFDNDKSGADALGAVKAKGYSSEEDGDGSVADDGYGHRSSDVEEADANEGDRNDPDLEADQKKDCVEHGEDKVSYEADGPQDDDPYHKGIEDDAEAETLASSKKRESTADASESNAKRNKIGKV